MTSRHSNHPFRANSARSESTRALLAAAEDEPDADGSPSGRKCRVTSFKVKVDDKRVEAEGNEMFLVTQHFSIDAEFTDGGDGACSCCEYRQYLRGYKKRKPPGLPWKTEDIPLWGGVPLSQDVYHEDGDPTKPDGVFGHRDIKCPVDSYEEDEGGNRATGCRYHAEDALLSSA